MEEIKPEIKDCCSKKADNKKCSIDKLTAAIVIATLFIVVFNAFQIQELKGKMGASAPSTPTGFAASGADYQTAAVPIISGIDVIPKGIPEIYGKELGLSYDDVSSTNQQKADSTIKKLGVLDQKLSLAGKDKERYISIAGKISCEYCCGVDSIITKDGEAACGCAHSFAMRGLTKYLIKNHGSEFTDDAILEELGKWKTLFFPSALSKKAVVLKSKGIELNYINLASNKYRGIETQGVASQESAQSSGKTDMTGWTEDEKMMYEHHGTLPSRLQSNNQQQQPNMVGGC